MPKKTHEQLECSDFESESQDEDDAYEDSQNPMEEDLNKVLMEEEVVNALGDADEINDKEDASSAETNVRLQKLVNSKKKKRKITLEETFLMEEEVANALGDADKINDKEDEASAETNDRLQKLVNNKKKKHKVTLEETSNKEEENQAETPTAPDENEEENVDLMLANPENNNMHLACIRCLNDQIYHPENSINENENVVALQLPLRYFKSKKPTLQEAKDKLKDLRRHNPHMNVNWKVSTVTEGCQFNEWLWNMLGHFINSNIKSTIVDNINDLCKLKGKFALNAKIMN